MSREIIEAVRTIEREKGIDGDTLIQALEDALLAAYKKTPDAARHATVELDDEGDFRVYSMEIPPDLEEQLLDEARERALDDLERLEVETGEKNHHRRDGVFYWLGVRQVRTVEKTFRQLSTKVPNYVQVHHSSRKPIESYLVGHESARAGALYGIA